jgi:predicted DCC family thiol-disulfide oxidoreductase YuxK
MVPKLVYDDDCGFCTRSALFIKSNSDITLVPFSEISQDLLEQLPENWRTCAHFFTENSVYSCGEAMERVYERTNSPLSRVFPTLRQIPGYHLIRECVYSWIASHRSLVGKLSRHLS